MSDAQPSGKLWVIRYQLAIDGTLEIWTGRRKDRQLRKTHNK
jgi:hypothetical protein